MVPDLPQPTLYKPTQAVVAPETVLFNIFIYACCSEVTDDRAIG